MAFYNTKIKEWTSSQRPIILEHVNHKQISLIQQGLVSLTEEPCSAVILNQLLYCTLRVPDFELFFAEEKRAALQDRSSFYHGWFSKSAQELLEETLLSVPLSTLRHCLSFLVEQGWIQARAHPQNKWDKTIQYRVSLIKLCIDLQNHGYSLPGFETYGVLPSSQQENSKKSKHLNIDFTINFASEVKNSFLKERPL